MKKLVSILMILAMIVPLAAAQSTDIFKKKKKKKSKTEAVDKAKADSIAKSKKDALQPYAKVITGKAKTMDGFFKVHYVDGKYFFEIADSLFGRDILIVNRVVKAPVDAQKRKVGYPGEYISDEVIRFEKGRGLRQESMSRQGCSLHHRSRRRRRLHTRGPAPQTHRRFRRSCCPCRRRSRIDP